MTDLGESQPEHKDRTLGLIVFGAASILIGICCAMLIPLNLVVLALSESEGSPSPEVRSVVLASALYAVMAVVFVWLGVGSIRARRWACELMLSLSWIWLVTGVCLLILVFFVMPSVVRETGARSGLPPEALSIIILVVSVLIGILFIVVPGLYVLFYRSPHVTMTCRIRHPEPQWIDACPKRLVTLMVVWVLLAVSVLMMPAYDFFFPFFGAVLTGAIGAVCWALAFAACVSLAVGTCRRSPWVWRGGVALTMAGALSSILTVLRFDFPEMIELLDLPEDQVAMISLLPVFDRWTMALAAAVVWGTFLVYLWTLRSSFSRVTGDGDR